MRASVRGFLCAAILPINIGVALAQSFPQPLATETIPAVQALPESYPASWIFVHDLNFDSLVDGRLALVDAAAERDALKGQVPAAQFANMLVSITRPEIYVAETFHARLTRGARTDVITIWDKGSLATKGEIELPGAKRGLFVTQKNAFQFTNGDKWALVFNFTPATSVTVIDLVGRKVLGDIDLPGCTLAYGQTETVLLCANRPGAAREGAMGRAAPPFDLHVIDHAGAVQPSGVEGDVALRVADERPPGLFVGYRDDPARSASVFRDGWYLTGDRAIVDEDGFFWFVGRADDVILTSGYRIGPFEVESALFEHPAVAESAVVASPDATRGEIVKAFVVLAPGHNADDAMVEALQAHVKSVTAPYKYPRRIEFVDSLPKTVSGKIRRKELRDREWSNRA